MRVQTLNLLLSVTERSSRLWSPPFLTEVWTLWEGRGCLLFVCSAYIKGAYLCPCWRVRGEKKGKVKREAWQMRCSVSAPGAFYTKTWGWISTERCKICSVKVAVFLPPCQWGTCGYWMCVRDWARVLFAPAHVRHAPVSTVNKLQ